MRVSKGLKMRRCLDLNQPGVVFVKVIGLLMVIIPAVLYGIRLLWGQTENVRILLLSMMKVSFAAGGLVFAVFLALIVAEQIQDHDFHVQYQKQRDQKVLVANGYYECQYCGNQKVRANDAACNVCGKEFAPAGRLTDMIHDQQQKMCKK